VIDSEGFRSNVGIVLTSRDRKVFWGRRIGGHGWQFPQGGIHPDETEEQCLYRELEEEIGLTEKDVTLLARSRHWYHYRLPEHMVRQHQTPTCIGQKQRWFLLQLKSEESHIHFDATDSPEFDSWRWVGYWYPLREVIDFKREVYQKALREFAPVLF